MFLNKLFKKKSGGTLLGRLWREAVASETFGIVRFKTPD
jgi:hypothetical protein